MGRFNIPQYKIFDSSSDDVIVKQINILAEEGQMLRGMVLSKIREWRLAFMGKLSSDYFNYAVDDSNINRNYIYWIIETLWATMVQNRKKMLLIPTKKEGAENASILAKMITSALSKDKATSTFNITDRTVLTDGFCFTKTCWNDKKKAPRVIPISPFSLIIDPNVSVLDEAEFIIEEREYSLATALRLYPEIEGAILEKLQPLSVTGNKDGSIKSVFMGETELSQNTYTGENGETSHRWTVPYMDGWLTSSRDIILKAREVWIRNRDGSIHTLTSLGGVVAKKIKPNPYKWQDRDNYPYTRLGYESEINIYTPSVIMQLLPVQIAHVKMRNLIYDICVRAGIPFMEVNVSEVRDEKDIDRLIGMKPGGVFPSNTGNALKVIQGASVPSALFETANYDMQDMKIIAGAVDAMTATARGKNPESAAAFTERLQQANQRVLAHSSNLDAGRIEIMEKMSDLIQKFYKEKDWIPFMDDDGIQKFHAVNQRGVDLAKGKFSVVIIPEDDTASARTMLGGNQESFRRLGESTAPTAIKNPMFDMQKGG